MLPVPYDPNTSIKLLSLDPGSESLGCAVYEFDCLTFELTAIHAWTQRGSRLPQNQWIAHLYGDRVARIAAHEDELLRTMQHHNPVAVVCESPFINIKRPAAYGALTEVVSAVRSATIRTQAWIPLYFVEPSTAKRAVGAKGNSDKDGVRVALRNNALIMSRLMMSIDMLDEHAVDAVAIGYHHYTQCREGRFPLY